MRYRWHVAGWVVLLLAGAATLALWHRTYSVWDFLEYSHDDLENYRTRRYWLTTDHGLIFLGHKVVKFSNRNGFALALHNNQKYRRDGFSYSSRASAKLTQVSVPIWIFVFTLTIPRFGRFRLAVRSQNRRRRGRCLSCGYNLTANTSGICPECGTEIPMSSVPKSASLVT